MTTSSAVRLSYSSVSSFPGQGNDAHPSKLPVDLRVVNDLSNEEDSLVGKDSPCGVGQIDSSLDTIAKTKLLGKADGRFPNGERAATIAELFNNGRVIVFFNFSLDESHDVGSTNVDSFLFLGLGGVTHGGGLLRFGEVAKCLLSFGMAKEGRS